VSGSGCDRVRGVEDRIDRLEERKQMIEPAARLESFFLYVEEPAEEAMDALPSLDEEMPPEDASADEDATTE